MQVTYVNNLINFIKENSDWREKLLHKPYSLKNILNVNYIPNTFMFNYNLFESELSNPIVKACRGTILEISDDRSIVKPVCLPYYKFFNAYDPNEDKVDWNTAVTHDKCDGQLIKLFKYKGQNYWCTNGSPNVETPLDYTDERITSYKELLEAAILGKKIEDLAPSVIRESYSYTDKAGAWHMHMDNPNGNYPTSWVSRIPDGWTLMFELCSPYNRIIVKYDNIKLWFHGARDAEGFEHTPEEVAKTYGVPFEIPRSYNFENMEKAFEAIKDWKGLENEGLVVCDADFHRVKVKCEDYLKIKFVRDVSTPKGIFWIVISEEYDDLASYPELEKLAEEQKNELLEVIEKLRIFHKNAVEKRNEFEDQKSFALWVNENHKEFSSYYFRAAKKSEKEFIDDLNKQLKSESSGYDKYLDLKSFVNNQ